MSTAAVGALAVGGLVVAGPALADGDGAGARSSVVERVTEALSGLVEDGSLTQAQADEVAETLAESGVGGRGGNHGGPGGGLGGGLASDAAAEVLGLSEQELRTALEAEDATVADVAEQEGVAVDTLVDALVTAGRERIADAAAEGRISQDEADARLAELEERVRERVVTPLPERPGPDREDAAEPAD